MKDLIVDPVSVREQVANIVRRQILTGELTPNQKLSEREISSSLGVSTTPVKEAFRMLETEGLIVTAPRKGTFVVEINEENLAQITYVRSALEGMATLFAASAATEEDLAAMGEMLEKSHQCIENHDVDGLLYHNSCFHEAIRNAVHNPLLFKLMQYLRLLDESTRVAFPDISDETRLQDHTEHENIYAALCAGDGIKAEQLMVKHVRTGQELQRKAR